ncbi:DUF1330 domain-containing protein [Tomitella gaofuii]|uniref:DUF1330 domain-containing protein n=1 Tax=Tomitella gaofuii TaxID=2760083 RepID=UPI0015F86A88|nr:DUF1330 domain-containing protein [Tomitella gaofuii]
MGEETGIAANTGARRGANSGSKGYAMAWLRDVRVGEEIYAYLARIEATMEPYGGVWLVHGSTPVPLEGDCPDSVVIIEFPSPDAARRWYESPGYQEILGLRTRNARSDTMLLEGVPAGYRALDTIEKLRAAG